MDAAKFSPRRLWKSAFWAGLGSGILLAAWGSGGWMIVGVGLLSGVAAIGCGVGTLLGRPYPGALIGADLATVAAVVGAPVALVIAVLAVVGSLFLRRR